MYSAFLKKLSKTRKGFTIIELLIFSAIFSTLMIAFISILVAVTTIHTRQTSVAEVNQQSQFLLQQIQYYIERASMIEMEPDVTTTTLKLRMRASAEDPTYIYLLSGVAYLQQANGSAQPLTSSKVSVSNLNFTKKINSPSHDSISISMLISYNTLNVKQKFAEALQTAVARVSAATFDFNVVPSSTASGQYKLGVSGQTWGSINDVIYFSGSNVGIGVSSPNSRLEVSGGDIYVDTVGKSLILRSANGTCFWITPTNAGAFSATSSTCP